MIIIFKMRVVVFKFHMNQQFLTFSPLYSFEIVQCTMLGTNNPFFIIYCSLPQWFLTGIKNISESYSATNFKVDFFIKIFFFEIRQSVYTFYKTRIAHSFKFYCLAAVVFKLYELRKWLNCFC